MAHLEIFVSLRCPCNSNLSKRAEVSPGTRIYVVHRVNPDVNDVVLTRVFACVRPSYTDENTRTVACN